MLKISAQSHAWQVDDIFGQKVGFLALFPGHTSPLPRIFWGDNTFGQKIFPKIFSPFYNASPEIIEVKI